MTELTRKNATIFSRLGQRGAIFGVSMLNVAKENDKIIALTADLATLSGLDRFIRTYPNQFINVGIAEQNMLGIAAGLSAEGFQPVVTTYATFLTMRACEQIRHFLGYMNLPIVAIGSGAGFSQGFAGNTHYTIEDISMMRAIPGLTILSPSDAGSAVRLFELSLKAHQPVYIRLTGSLNCPIIYDSEIEFSLGGSNVIRHGNDIAIFATGTMVHNALLAADILKEKNVSASVIDMYSLKPLDNDAIAKMMSSKLFVTVEEHNTIGGLGAAVAEYISSYKKTPTLLRLGVNDAFDTEVKEGSVLAMLPELEKYDASALKKYGQNS